jgi:hypothetical protein
MAIELEVGKQYITRDGTEYTAPLDGFRDFGYIATTYKSGTTISTATRTWAYGGSWVGTVEHELDLVAEYNPEESKMIGKVIVNIEAGKTYRTREGKEVTLESWDEYTLTGKNGFLYSKSLTGSVYSCKHSEFDIVEEIVKESVTTFTTQQEICKHLVSGGYVSYVGGGGELIYGFSEEGVLGAFDRYGEFSYEISFTFNAPSGWKVATIEPKPVPRWEDALKDKKILCRVGDNEDRLDTIAFVISFTKSRAFPYLVESAGGTVYAFAKPLTLEEVTNYIYECE